MPRKEFFTYDSTLNDYQISIQNIEIRNEAGRHPMVEKVAGNYAFAFTDALDKITADRWQGFKDMPEYEAFRNAVIEFSNKANNYQVTDSDDMDVLFNMSRDVIMAGRKLGIALTNANHGDMEGLKAFKDYVNSMCEGHFNPATSDFTVTDDIRKEELDRLEKIEQQMKADNERKKAKEAKMPQKTQSSVKIEIPAEEEEPELSGDTVAEYQEYLRKIKTVLDQMNNRAKKDKSFRPSVNEVAFAEKVDKAIEDLEEYFLGGPKKEITKKLNDVASAGYNLGLEKSKRSFLGEMAYVLSKMAKDRVENPLMEMSEYINSLDRFTNNALGEEGRNLIGQVTEEQIHKRNQMIIDNMTPDEKKRYEFIQENNKIFISVNPKYAMSESEMVNKATDTKIAEEKAISAKLMNIQNNADIEKQRLREKYNIPMIHPSITRMVICGFDMSGTPEAEQKNVELLKKASTKEGAKELAEGYMSTLLNMTPKTLTAHTHDEMLKTVGENTVKLYLAYCAIDILNNGKDLGIDTALWNNFENNQLFLTSAGKANLEAVAVDSTYYMAIPDKIDIKDIEKIQNAFNKNAGERAQKYGIKTKLSSGKVVSETDNEIAKIVSNNAMENYVSQSDAEIWKQVDNGKLSKPTYVYQCKDENGNLLSLNDGMRALDKGQKIEFVERSGLEIREIEKAMNKTRSLEANQGADFENGLGKESDGINRTRRHLDVQTDSIIEETENEEAYEIMESFTPEQQKKYDLIERNNEIIASVYPEKKMSLKQMVDMTFDTSADEARRKLADVNDITNRCKNAFSDIKKQFDGQPTLSMAITRLASFEMDLSGTPEAEKKNVDFVKSLMTKEGQTKYAEQCMLEILNAPASKFLTTNDQESIDLYAEDPKFILKAWAVVDIITNKATLPVDDNLCNLLNDKLKTIQAAGNVYTQGTILGSSYNGTLPPLSMEELVVLLPAFSNHLKEHPEELAKYDLIEGNNDTDYVFEQIMAGAMSKNITYSENKNILEYLDRIDLKDTPIGKIFGQDEKGITKMSAIADKIGARKDNCTFTLGSKEVQEKTQKLLDGETVNKENNAIDYARRYDEDKAYFEALDKEYKEHLPEISMTLYSLEKVMQQQGLGIKNSIDSVTLVALVEDESGNLVKQPLFVDFPDEVGESLNERMSAQCKIEIRNAGQIETNLIRQRVLEINKLLKEGRVFIDKPGQLFDEAQHVYVQEDGNVGISQPKGSNEPVYYGNDKDLLEKNRKIGVDLRNRMVLQDAEKYKNMSAEEFQKAENKLSEERNLWYTAKKDSANVEKIWSKVDKNSIIFDKMVAFVSSCKQAGISDEDIRDGYSKLDRTTKLSNKQIRGFFDNKNVKIKLVDSKEAKKRAELTEKARKICLDIALDKNKRVDLMDISDPSLRKMLSSRSLKAVLLDHSGDIKKNVEIARRWFGGDNTEKANLLNENIKRMLTFDYQKFNLNMSDEELVDNYREYYEKAAGLNEVVQEFANLERNGVKIDPELKEKTMELMDYMSGRSYLFINKLTTICSDLYSKVDANDFLKHPDEIEMLHEDERTEIDKELDTFVSSCHSCSEGYNVSLNDELLTKMGYPSIGDSRSNAVLYDETGKIVNQVDTYKRALNNETLFVGSKGNEDVRAFKYDFNSGTIVEKTADPKIAEKITNIHLGIAGKHYIDNLRYDPSRSPEPNPNYGRGLQQTCSEMYNIVAGADSMFTRSSKEFRNIKEELESIANQNSVPNPYQAQQSIKKINDWAKTYIDGKNEQIASGKKLSSKEQKRYDAINQILGKTGSMMEGYSKNMDGAFTIGKNKEAINAESAKFENFGKFFENMQMKSKTDYATRVAGAAIKDIIIRERASNTAVTDGAFEKIINKCCKDGNIDKVVEEFKKLPSIKDFIAKNPESVAGNSLKVISGDLTKGIGANVMKDIQTIGAKTLIDKIAPEKKTEKKIEAENPQLKEKKEEVKKNNEAPSLT